MLVEHVEKYVTANSVALFNVLTFDLDCACRYVVFYNRLQKSLNYVILGF
jgi:hypothetical protein